MAHQTQKLPAMARLMRETDYAKGEEALIEGAETKSAPTAKSERSVIGVS